ncbi:UNVERIFIED_CONTAM: protein SPIRRIG, partial [Sesamum calycinum]
AGSIRLREDNNAHGYHFLVHFALTLSKNRGGQTLYSNLPSDDSASDSLHAAAGLEIANSIEKGGNDSAHSLSPTLSRLLDVIVNFAQAGPSDGPGSSGLKSSKSSHPKPNGHGRSRTSSSDRIADDIWEKDNDKVKDLEAVQMLQDILIKAESTELQAEVLNRLFKMFSSHLENYKLCQQLRTVPLLINMAGFPLPLQEIILKILEYAVSVVNIIPEQELLSLCCLLQQPITSELKHTILSFLLNSYHSINSTRKSLEKWCARGSVDVEQHKFLLGPEQLTVDHGELERKNSSSSFKKHLDSKDAILSSPKLLESGSGKLPLFEVEGTISVAWDCLVSLLKKAETNQASFRSANGVTFSLPLLASDVHRSGVLRVLSCLIIEDVRQAHPEELGALVEILKSGMVTSTLGSQYTLQDDAKCDAFGALWRILGANGSAQRVFGEATGFSLLLTTLHSFQSDGEQKNQPSISLCIKVFTYMLRVMTAGVSDNAINRTKVHTILSSQTFYDLLSESGLICVECERQVIQLFLELALEVVLPPFLKSEEATVSHTVENESASFLLITPSGSLVPDKERVYNAAAVRVLIRALLLFTPKVQLELLNLIEKLACCVQLLLEIIYPLLSSTSPLVSHALKIVEVLGAYRLSVAELRILVRYIFQMRLSSSGRCLVEMMERLILSENTGSEDVSLATFVELDMSKIGHASIQVPLGERSWPPAAGYSFVCWFQFRNLLRSPGKETEAPKTGSSRRHVMASGQQVGPQVLRIFSVGAVDNGSTFNAELCLQDDGLLTLATSNSSSLTFSGLEMEEGRWHHLAVEVLSPGSICFMYILGRGYRGLFQDTDLLQFVPNQACGGGSMAILDSLDTDLPLTSNMQKPETAGKQGISKVDHSGIVWDSDKLGNLSLQLWGKKMIFAFDGTSTEMFRASGTLSVLNLVDPLSAAASPIGGIPRFGRLLGDIYVCKHCVIGDTIRPVGGMGVVLALVEAAETRDMLHMSLTLLACALHQNPQNVRDMQKFRGYHLLALFLQRRMSLFDMQSLEIFFQIAACEASFSEPRKTGTVQNALSPGATINETSFEDLNLSKFRDEFSSVGSQADMDDFSAPKDSFSHISELENTDMPETSNCIVLSNADMVEHVLLDWTVWVAAPIPIQIALLGFLEHLVSMHWYRNHNLTILRRINLVQHLLVTLQRGDVEVPVLEKLVVLLGVILEDGFLQSELELVVRFVIMTFDPPELTSRDHITRESMGKHVIVRNMLLEMLIDLQVTIQSEELLEQWHKIVSSKLITYFLDEAVHPTSMRWIMTLLGVCIASSPTFALKFRSSGGYQGLTRLPEVRMLDFHALMPSDSSCGELKFVELLESVIAMAKSTFDRIVMQSMLAHQTGNLSQIGASLVAELVDGNVDMAGELQGEALMHKTYAARLMGGDASAPAATTSVLRFMVDLAKMCPPFSAVCRRAEFLESCVDLYFSCVRAAHAVRMAKELTVKTEDKNLNDCDDSTSSHNTFSSLPQEHETSGKTSISIGSFAQGNVSASSEDMPTFPNNMASEKPEIASVATVPELDKSVKEDAQAVVTGDGEALDQLSNATSGSNEFNFRDTKSTPDHINQNDSQSSISLTLLESPISSERSSSRIPLTQSSSPVLALTSWIGSASHNDIKVQPVSVASMESSMSVNDTNSSSDLKAASQTQFASNTLFVISPKLILEVDDSGYGGGPCSAGATAVLDFLAEVLSDFVTEQMKAASVVETVLESVPLYADAESVLVFQGLCLTRLMNFLERRLLRDDEEDEKKLDKARWSSNLDALSWMIVDRMYMGAFPQPAGVLKTLEFLLSMLQLANKDGRIEETIPTGKGLLSIDLHCCLCINLISLLHDPRQNVQNAAVDILKYLLVHRRAALEEFFVSKPNQGPSLDVLHGGFDKLLTGNLSGFFEWFHNSESVVSKVLEQCAAIMWVQYITGSAKFPGVRIKGMDSRRKREVGRKSRDISKLEQRHWDQVNERRIALELVRDAMATELRVIRQDKYGWVLHAESEWQTHLQQLLHERGIFPISKSSIDAKELEWQLCPIEGPYRMRKKLERCKLKIDSIQNILDGQLMLGEGELPKEKAENQDHISETGSDVFFNILTGKSKDESFNAELYDASTFKESDDARDIAFSGVGWNDDRESSINEASLHSATEFGVKSSAASTHRAESIRGKSELGSPRQSSSLRTDEVRIAEDKTDKELNDNGEYLIRPYLEPFERIKYKYNCERVVGLDKHDGIFLIGELSLYVIENFYIDDSGCICEKESEDELSIIDQALGVKKDFSCSMDSHSKSTSSWGAAVKAYAGGRAWAYNGGAWGKEKVASSSNVPHLWRIWKLDSVHELLKRDYQLRPVAIEIFSMDGCNDLLVFHKREREEVFKNLVAMNLPRNSILDATISGSTKQESNEGSRLFKVMAKSFSKRWQNGEISNFQYIMHLNTLAGRGYSDLTQYPVFPWVLADYESEKLDFSDPKTFRNLEKPMGCQTLEGEEEFKKSVRDTWSSAAGKGNTSDVKELIPEFFYMPEFLENRFDLDLGEKQSGEKVGDVVLPPWAKGSAREFIRKHREALESDYVSEHLHHWIDLIFGYKQRGKAAEEAVNVFYHYTYEGSVDIDSVTDPAMKASILAQINHFGQTPKQLFLKPHVKRRTDRRLLPHPLRHSMLLVPHEIRKSSSSISQIVTLSDKILVAGSNNLLKPTTFTKYVAWGFPDRSLRFVSYDQDRLLSTHENLHGGNQSSVSALALMAKFWLLGQMMGWFVFGELEKTDLVLFSSCNWRSLFVVILLPEFPSPVSAIYVNDLTGEIVTAAGVMLAVWSINGDCLAVVNTSQLPSDFILSLTGSTFSDWLDTNWYVSGHQSGAVKVWKMVHSTEESAQIKQTGNPSGGLALGNKVPEYRLILHKVLKSHKFPVTALHLSSDLKHMLSGDSGGQLISWTLPDESLRSSMNRG